jgi:hypothetical protein
MLVHLVWTLRYRLVIMERKEVKTMKIATSFLAALLFAGTLGAFNNAIAEDGILAKDSLTSDPYCHEKFPAIRQNTLGTDRPELESSTGGDPFSAIGITDFYGPCDENPLGQDQIRTQKLEQQHRWENNHSPD